MSPERKWLTEGEIEAVFHRLNDNLLERLENGAQASLNTAMLLFGDERYGVRGFVPEIKERLAKLEDEQSALKESQAAQHAENQGRLERVEANQGWILKGVHSTITKVSPIVNDWKTLTGCAVAFGGTTLLPPHWIRLTVQWCRHHFSN